MNNQIPEFDSLVSNKCYIFHTKDWETPFGEIIPGTAKVRRFLRNRGLRNGKEIGIGFIEVARESGRTHLIALETIESIYEMNILDHAKHN